MADEMFEPEEVDEALEESEETSEPTNGLPEAPASVTVRFWIDDYGVLFTMRDEQVKELVAKLDFLMDYAKKRGWKPSWNKEGIKSAPAPAKAEPVGPLCSLHKRPMKERIGPDGSVFYSHAMKDKQGNWMYCSGKGFVKG